MCEAEKETRAEIANPKGIEQGTFETLATTTSIGPKRNILFCP